MYPILIQNKFFEIYSYPFMIGIAFAVAYFLFESRSKLANKNFIFITISFFSFLGAKLFYLLVNRNFHILDDQNFWMGGGFVFFGGLVFGSLCLILYFKIKKISLSELNQFVLPLIAAHSLGRLGCFLAGCCYGHHHMPLPIFESIFLIILGLIIYKKNIKNQVIVYLTSYAVFRFIIEFFRDDFRGQLISNLLSPSQEISLLILIGLSFYFFFFRKIN
jgi:phosphatidylglycerol:prolipoprotein diacylglycerol transferase